MRNWLLAGFFLCSLAGNCYSQDTQLSEYIATYEANANGLAATASRRLSRLDENSYRLINSLEATLAGQTLARLNQTSEFVLEEQRVIPQNYSYTLSGISRASHAIAYNWEAGVAISNEDDKSWRLSINPGVMDQLSYQVALRQTLRDNLEPVSSFSFEIIDGDEIDTQEYRVVGREAITTPLGILNTLKLERVREASDDRVTEIWLAIDWEFLLARLEQINGSGLHIVLELRTAEIGGENVRANN